VADLGERRLVVITGKGGVGKSTVTAALGRALARGGRRVLALEVDPRENVHQLLEVPPSGGEVVEAGGSLSLQNLRPTGALDDIVRRQVRVELVARRILASPIYRQFAEGMPGLKELAVLDAASGHSEFDTVVLDAPATGHGLALLSAPGLVARTLSGGPVAEAAERLAVRVGDPAHTAIVVVTTAEPMPADEALELSAALAERLGRLPDLLVVNGLYPPFPGELEGRAAAGGPLALWRDRRAVNDLELARLDAGWAGPRVELPLLPLPRGRSLVAELARRLLGEEAA
jgi:anion-transporting  ArsA/GET3 family ATPase